MYSIWQTPININLIFLSYKEYKYNCTRPDFTAYIGNWFQKDNSGDSSSIFSSLSSTELPAARMARFGSTAHASYDMTSPAHG